MTKLRGIGAEAIEKWLVRCICCCFVLFFTWVARAHDDWKKIDPHRGIDFFVETATPPTIDAAYYFGDGTCRAGVADHIPGPTLQWFWQGIDGLSNTSSRQNAVSRALKTAHDGNWRKLPILTDRRLMPSVLSHSADWPREIWFRRHMTWISFPFLLLLLFLILLLGAKNWEVKNDYEN